MAYTPKSGLNVGRGYYGRLQERGRGGRRVVGAQRRAVCGVDREVQVASRAFSRGLTQLPGAVYAFAKAGGRKRARRANAMPCAMPAIGKTPGGDGGLCKNGQRSQRSQDEASCDTRV